MKTKIIFIPTWVCNLSHICPKIYCDYQPKGFNELDAFGKHFDIGMNLEWHEWNKYLKRFAPFHLEMTGGEPTVYKDIDRLINNLPDGCTWGTTSNTLQDKVIRKFDFSRCMGWTASYHFQESRDTNFMTNLWYLRTHGANPRVTIVVHPDLWEKAKEKLKIFKKYKYGVNLHPLLKQGFMWNNHGDIYEEAKSMHDGRFVNFIDEIPDMFQGERFESCRAGSNDYFMVWPDGKVRRCYSQMLADDDEGFIWDWEPRQGATPCAMNCIFPCDKEIAKQEVAQYV